MNVAATMPAPGFGVEAFRALGLYVDEEFLSPALCSELAAATRCAEKIEPAGVYKAERAFVDEDYRRAKCVHLPKPLRKAAQERFELARPRVAEHFGIELAGAEAPQFLRYGVGDFFKPHIDSGDGAFALRRVSAVVFLNDARPAGGGGYDGGELKLYGLLKGKQWAGVGLPFIPRAGFLVAFASTVAHEVQRVTAGERLTVVTWFHG
jgi:predicted 2-oxoglutarate/Fe(II)-dependent dioxygenase YbiX